MKPVRELLGVMIEGAAAGGIVVTSGEFTQDAIVFAEKKNIKLLNGEKLHEMIKKPPLKKILRRDLPRILFAQNAELSW